MTKLINLKMTLSSSNCKHPKLFGVINLTPNSFSDGGVFLDHQKLQTTLESWSRIADLTVDFGAESTAPMNSKVDLAEEIRRLDSLFDHHASLLQKFSSLSFDTYKSETFFHVLDRCKHIGYSGHLYWNDVSGCYEPCVQKALENHQNLTWILCHTLVPERSLSGSHKNYAHLLSPETVIESMKEWFDQRLSKIDPSLHSQLMLDPCFGFSKDVATNQALCENLESLLAAFEGRYPWLIGISKKRFLQQQLPESLQEQGVSFTADSPYAQKLEQLHFFWLQKWQNSPYSQQLSFRIHHPEYMRDALFA